MTLRPKVTVAFFLVSALVSVVLAVFLYRFVERQLAVELRDKLRDITHVGAQAIDAAAYQRLAARLGTLDDNAVLDIEHSADVVDADVRALNARVAKGETVEDISRSNKPSDLKDIPLLERALSECSAQLEPDFVADPTFGVRSISAYVPRVDGLRAPLRDPSSAASACSASISPTRTCARRSIPPAPSRSRSRSRWSPSRCSLRS